MKSIIPTLIGSIIGGLLGFMIGSGESSWVKKSQQERSFPVMAIAGLLLGGISGLIISVTVTKDEEKSIQYGFDSIKTYENKTGRKWEFQTIWNNPTTGNQNKIHTLYSNLHTSVVTTLNDVPIFTHDSTDGSKIFIQKVHMQSVNEIRKKIQNSALILI